MSRGRAGKRPVIADGRYGTYRHGDEHALDDERPLFHDDDHSFHHLAAMFAASARSAVLSASLGRRAASTIAQKYSSAVFSAALKKSPQVLNKVQTELNAIHSAVKSTPELDTFIHNPTLSSNDRAAGLPAIYAAAGKEVSDITKNLFGVLSENGRLVEAQGVIEGFNELVAKYKGELDVTITSAAPLPRDIQTRLETLLKQSQAAQQAKSLKITNKVRLLISSYRFCD